jgi:diguanylate cyclase (GGDEF)-like protein
VNEPTTRPLALSNTGGIRSMTGNAWFAAGFALLVYTVIQVLPISSVAQARMSALAGPVVLALSLWACVRTARVSTGKNMRLWRVLSISVLMLLTGMIARAWYVFGTGSFGPAGSMEDLGFGLGILTMVPVVLLMTDSFDAQPMRKTRNVLDFASAVAALFIAVFIGISIPLRTYRPEQSPLANVAFIAFPVLIGSTVAYLVTFKRGHWRSFEAILLGALTLGAIGVVSFVVGIGLGWTSPQHPLSVIAGGFLVASFSLFGVAAVHYTAQPARNNREATVSPEQPHWPATITQIGTLVALPVLMVYSTGLRGGTSRVILTAAVSVGVALVIARNLLATHESRRLAAEAIIDPLTGLFNRRHFQDRVVEEVRLALASSNQLVLYVAEIEDLDHFVSEYGYGSGDRRIRGFATDLLRIAPSADLVFRTGRGSFARLMPSANVDEARIECDRLAEEFAKVVEANRPRLVFSAGIASIPEHTANPAELVRLAEGALYWAHVHQPGHVVIYDSGIVEALDSRQHVERLKEQTHSRLVETLAAAVDARDPYTQDHSANVSRLCIRVATALGLDDVHTELLGAAGQLHDIGKLGVPDAVLRKPGSLTDGEYALIKEHPALGVRILAASARPEMLPWILQHHERLDGTGYPSGLGAESIVLEARILSVCDAYDAITTDRPYRSGAPADSAIEELRRHTGTQFDSEIVEILASVVQS